VLFVYHGKRHTFTLGRVSRVEAENKASQVDYALMRLRQGLLNIPPSMDVTTFMEFDGKPPAGEAPQESKNVTLAYLRDRYFETHGNGSLEQTTIDGIRIHFKHLAKTLGDRFPLQTLALADLQGHADRRAKMKGRSGRLSPATIKKEIITLRVAWNWAVHMNMLSGRFPNAGLRFPKFDEKPPFRTFQEIERRIAAGGSSEREINELWGCLYLRTNEIVELLAYVRENATQPWVYPLFCTAAHTGARRSELLRLSTHDVDLDGNTIVIHEKKRTKEKRTTRRVSLTPFLKTVLKQWLANHPGSQHLFCQTTKVVRSKTWRKAPTPVTRDEGHDHFKRTLAGSKWQVLKGFHSLRHSFISCLASAGVDQRIIDDFVGHQTDEQRLRYRHLLPNVKEDAIKKTFGM
jgi:integrase